MGNINQESLRVAYSAEVNSITSFSFRRLILINTWTIIRHGNTNMVELPTSRRLKNRGKLKAFKTKVQCRVLGSFVIVIFQP